MSCGANENRRRKDSFQITTGSGVIISIDESRTSSSLLKKAKAFDEGAWQELVDSYGDRIYGWALRTRMPAHDAADITAEVFAAIVRKIRDFRRDRKGDSFRKWVRTITKNKIRDYWRDRQRVAAVIGGSRWEQQLKALAMESSDASQSAAASTSAEPPRYDESFIEKVRAEVSRRDWAMFERLTIDEYSPAQVAEEFGTSLNVVYLAKSRLSARLASWRRSP